MSTPFSMIRITDTAELLAYIPFRLGYQPSESVVVASLHGENSGQMVGLMAQLELQAFEPTSREACDIAFVAAQAVSRAATPGNPDRVVVVGYADMVLPAAAAVGTRVRRAVESTLAYLQERFDEAEAWIVTPKSYRALECTDVTCCPVAGRDIEELQHHRIAAQMVLKGHSYAPSRQARMNIPAANSAARQSVGRAAARWEKARASMDATRWGEQSLQAWYKAVHHAQLAHQEDYPTPVLGRLGAALAATHVRDGILVAITSSNDSAARRAVAGHVDMVTDVATGRAMTQIVDPQTAVEPPWGQIVSAVCVLEEVVAHNPRSRQVAPLTLLALIAWWSGDGSMASSRLALALSIDNTYTLARLVSSALHAGLPPGWVRHKLAKMRTHEEPVSG